MYKHLFDFAKFLSKKCKKICKYISFWVFFVDKKRGITQLLNDII